MFKLFFIFIISFLSGSCNQSPLKTVAVNNVLAQPIQYRNDKNIKVIHVFVALCDNKYQGIVPVPAKIGNGQDPANNLYWGCGFGVKTFFCTHKNWQLVSDKKSDSGSMVLERLVFKYNAKEIYLVADAYDGRQIKTCTVNFLKSCSGNFSDSARVNNMTIFCGGASQLVTYIGHDGLMDFSISETYKAIDSQKREAMIFACISKKYFAQHIKNTGALPVVWTSGLCSPEAYSLAAALESRINNEVIEKSAFRSAEAYSKYQKCGIAAAQKLMVYN
jgi:hypothetical protein